MTLPEPRRLPGLSARFSAQLGAFKLDVSLEVGAETLVLIGPNGSGKTSLLKLLLGALPLTQGHLIVSGRILADTDKRIALPIEERRLGYVPQDYGLFPHLSVERHLEFALTSLPRRSRPSPPAQTHQIQTMLESLQLASLRGRLPQELSGGERQRLALARALVAQPSALLLDEPLAALDAIHRREVSAFLASYLQTLTIPTLLITHDPRDLAYFSARVAVLEAGRIVQEGTWSELCEAPGSPFVAQFAEAEHPRANEPRR